MLKIILIVIGILAVLFVLSLIVFFFNLDMKMAAKMGGILNSHYDRIKRDRMDG